MEQSFDSNDKFEKNDRKMYQNLKQFTKQSDLTNSYEMKTFEVGSVESSDTYLSCCTHPFNSLADLTEDANEDNSRAELLHNVYINPMEVMDQSCKQLNFEQSLVRVPLIPLNPLSALNAVIPINQNKIDDNLTKETKKLNVISSEQLCNDSFSLTSHSSHLIKKPKFLQGLRTRFDESAKETTKDFHESSKQLKQKMTIKTPFFPYRGQSFESIIY